MAFPFSNLPGEIQYMIVESQLENICADHVWGGLCKSCIAKRAKQPIWNRSFTCCRCLEIKVVDTMMVDGSWAAIIAIKLQKRVLRPGEVAMEGSTLLRGHREDLLWVCWSWISNNVISLRRRLDEFREKAEGIFVGDRMKAEKTFAADLWNVWGELPVDWFVEQCNTKGE